MNIHIPELREISMKLDQIIQLLGGRDHPGQKSLAEEVPERTLPAKRFMTTRELAVYLRLAETTIRKYTSAKQIPYRKIGRKVLFELDEIDEWVKIGSRRQRRG